MSQTLISSNERAFKSHFQEESNLTVLSPGRINIIGEHLDYNDGLVLPAAIDKYICFSIAKNDSDTFDFFANDLNESFQWKGKSDFSPVNQSWVNYLLGILHELQLKGIHHLSAKLVFSSNIPIGAGLSSSAALTCGFAFALNELFDLKLTKEEIALMGQKAEQKFAGVNCGIMDQFASVFGKKNQVIQLDCSTLEYHYFSAELEDYQFLLIDSKVKHTHLTSGYNDRRNEMTEGFEILEKYLPNFSSFRDCTEEMLESLKDKFSETVFKRCHYVVKEMKRVEIAIQALQTKDFALLGTCMYQTHKGLSEEYEVSCDELDFLANFAQQENTVLGARMMGGGFGGCSINLIQKTAVDSFISKISTAYRERFGIDIQAYKIDISDGTQIVSK